MSCELRYFNLQCANETWDPDNKHIKSKWYNHNLMNLMILLGIKMFIQCLGGLKLLPRDKI